MRFRKGAQERWRILWTHDKIAPLNSKFDALLDSFFLAEAVIIVIFFANWVVYYLHEIKSSLLLLYISFEPSLEPETNFLDLKHNFTVRRL